jgi:hypothetical protein
VGLRTHAERGCESSSSQFGLDGNFFIRSRLRDHCLVLFRAAGIGLRDAFVMSERREQSKKAAGHRGNRAMNSKGTNGGTRIVENEGLTEDCISERRLWTAVVVMAVEDWRNGSLRARREAQSFLFEDNADFQAVCASAGLDPATLRARLLKIGQRVHMHGPYLQPMAA